MNINEIIVCFFSWISSFSSSSSFYRRRRQLRETRRRRRRRCGYVCDATASWRTTDAGSLLPPCHLHIQYSLLTFPTNSYNKS